MPASRPKSAFWQGFQDALPFTLIVTPFALVFGVLAVDAGLSALQAFGFSVIVVAGAGQLAALQLMAENAPVVVIIGTALAVNLRMAMYSASLAPHLGHASLGQRMLVAYLNVDQSYAMAMEHYEATPGLSGRDKLYYFFGVAAPVVPLWFLGTLVGAITGQGIPETVPLDLAIPIAFIALVSLMLRSPAHWFAAATSVVLALLLHTVPYNLGLVIAGAAAMGVGAVAEANGWGPK